MLKRLLILSVLFVLFNSCRDSVIEPNIPGSSDYVWINERLNNEHSLYRLWATSENFVLACGDGELWQYDGKKWTMDNNFRPYNAYGIGGVDKNNIWLVSSGNYNGVDIYRNNGWSWSKYGHYEYNKVQGSMWINNIWAKSVYNVYAVGAFETKNASKNRGIIMKFDGYLWRILDIPVTDVNFYGITGDRNDKIYVYGEKIERDTTTNPITITGFTRKIYEYDGDNSLKEIYSDPSKDFYPININGLTYFIGQRELWIYNPNQFISINDFSDSEYYVGNAMGRNLYDLILWCRKESDIWGPNYILHYNGSVMKQIFSADDIYGILLVGNNIFAINVSNDSKWSIARGRLSSSFTDNSSPSAYINTIQNNPISFSNKIIHSMVIKMENKRGK